MTSRRSRFKWVVITLLAVFILAGAALGAFLYIHSLQAEELRQAAVRSCQHNGNPLRRVLQHRINREIKQAENITLLEKLFPSLTPKELDSLISHSLTKLEKERELVSPIPCEKTYPK